MPERPSSSSMTEVDVGDVPKVTLDQLTRLLYMNPPCMDRDQTVAWLALQSRQIESLNKILLRPKGLLSNLAISMGKHQVPFMKIQASLCKSHNSLDARLIRNLTIRLANELTIHVDRYRHHQRKNTLPKDVKKWLDRIDAIMVVWMGRDIWEKNFGRRFKERLPYCVEKSCEACKIAFIGGSIDILNDVRASLLARQGYVYGREGEDAAWHNSELLRVVESWIDTCYPRDVRTRFRQQSEALVPTLVDLRVEMRKLRTQRRERDARKARKIPMPRGKPGRQVRITRAERERVERLLEKELRRQRERTGTSESAASTADAYTSTAGSSRPPTTTAGSSRPPTSGRSQHQLSDSFFEEAAPVDGLTQAMQNTHVDDATDEEEEYEAMSPITPSEAPQGEAPIWGWLRRNHESDNEEAEQQGEGSRADSPWAEAGTYRQFITEGGSGGDYYEEDVVASGPSNPTYPTNQPPSAFSQQSLVPEPLRKSDSSSQPSGRLRQHEREPMRPLLQESSIEYSSSSQSSKKSSQKQKQKQPQAPPPPPPTSSRGRLADQSASRRPRDLQRPVPQGSSSDAGRSRAPSVPLRSPRRPSVQFALDVRDPPRQQASRLPQPVAALMSSGSSSKYSSSECSDDDSGSGGRQVDELTLANLEGYRMPQVQRIAHRPRIHHVPANAYAPAQSAEIHSGYTSSSSEESQPEPEPVPRPGAQGRDNEPSAASCYSTMGWGGPSKKRHDRR